MAVLVLDEYRSRTDGLPVFFKKKMLKKQSEGAKGASSSSLP